MADEAQEIDYEGMDDAEFNKLPIPGMPQEEEREEPTSEEEVETPEEEIEEVEDSEEESEDEPQEETEDEEEETTEDSVEEEDSDPVTTLLKTPLKMGDTEITVNSVEELVTLAQRGLGANKRIQELAPQLKIISMLEKHKLMSPEKLNFLIALENKDPKAIRQLVASSGVDAFDVDVSDAEEGSYTPPDFSVTDEEYAVEQAFSDISTLPSYEDTLKTMSSFDNSAKAELRSNPQLIRQMAAQHENGEYKQIKDIIAKERVMGNLPGLSDFAAYKHVWNTVQEYSARTGGNPEAGHKNLTNGQSSRENLVGSEGTREAGHNTSSGKQIGNAQSAARKAAESTNKNRGSQKAEFINFDDLSDEEFLKLELA